MQNKIYSSFEEIDRELEILAIEKEISYNKLILSSENFTSFFTAKTIFKKIISSGLNLFSSPNFSIIKLILPIVYNWFLNKKSK